MKVSRLFTIDVEIAEKLQTIPNQSSFVNALLKENFVISSKKTNILEQKEEILSNFKKKSKEMRKEIKIFKEFESFGLDNFSIRWIKGQETEPSIWMVREYIRGRQLKITTEQFLNAYRLINKHGDIFKNY